MKLHETIFKNKHLDKLIRQSLHNNWQGTLFEDYPKMDPKQKGGFGEVYVEGYVETLNDSKVNPPKGTGHDRIIDGYRTEIKFSLASSNTKKDGKLIDPDCFTFNHIAIEKDWERFIFCGINPQNSQQNVRRNGDEFPPVRAYFMLKEDFENYMNSANNTIFKKQQGGKKSKNDDYMVTGHIQGLIDLPFVKPLIQW